jgi:hypothetical protein
VQQYSVAEVQGLLSNYRVQDHLVYLNSEYLENAELQSFFQQRLSDPGHIVEQLQAKTAPASTGNWATVLLLLIWISYAGHYAYEPTYRKSIARFFFNHSFFANDVLNRHERIGLSSLVVIIQSCLLVGLALEFYSSYFLTEAARQVLSSNHFFFKVVNLIPWGYFLLGSVFCGINILLGLTWLRFALPEVRFMYQVTPLYSWFYHTLFIIVPIWVVAMKFPGLNILVLLSAFFTILVLFGAFVVVASDAAKQNPALRQQIFLRTLYPYLILIGVLGYFLLVPTGLYSSFAFANKLAMQALAF